MSYLEECIELKQEKLRHYAQILAELERQGIHYAPAVVSSFGDSAICVLNAKVPKAWTRKTSEEETKRLEMAQQRAIRICGDRQHSSSGTFSFARNQTAFCVLTRSHSYTVFFVGALSVRLFRAENGV